LKLGHFGLLECFAFGGFGDDHYERDDVARAALRAASPRHEASAGDVWVIGDTPLDIRCARAIGARVLAVATGVHTSQELADSNPDALLDDLSNTRELLALLLS
jgi:phosphoglycolate phosphatase